MVMPAHVTCEACGRGWIAEDLEVVQVEPGAGLTAADAVECPACHRLLEVDCSAIKPRTALDVSRGAAQRIERHHGRPSLRGKPVVG
jgi:hypothetical protein